MEETTNANANAEEQGVFLSSLKRNNKQIRDDRATTIAEDAEMSYRRMVEDLIQKRKRLVRDRDGMLDLSPTTAQSLVLASDFDGVKFSGKDLDLGADTQSRYSNRDRQDKVL